ncbi:c-type cytochrome [Emcibacter nanhaiensis]|nr:cytochrome c [Emcibacter nanhaiensis]
MRLRRLHLTLALVATAGLAGCTPEEETEVKSAEISTPTSIALEGAAPRPTLTGTEVFARQCANCHAAGDDHTGSFQLARSRGEEYAVLEERTDLSADYIRQVVRTGINTMPGFSKVDITEQEMSALTDYLVKTE